MKIAQQLALWADKLRDVSAMGWHFARSSYDREHYRAVQDVAMAMLAAATGNRWRNWSRCGPPYSRALHRFPAETRR